jgi:HK97 family phage portal protein
MGLFNRTKALATKAVSDLSGYLAATVTVRDRSLSQYSRNLETQQLLAVARGYVYNCADIIAMAASQQPLRLYRTGSVTIRTNKGTRHAPGCKAVKHAKREAFASGRMGRKAATWSGMGGNVAEVVDHPVLDLITKPNPLQNGEAFDYQRFLFALLTGEMFHLVEGTDAPSALWPMLPQYTQVMPEMEGVVGRYAYGRERAAVAVYEAADVLHFKYSDHLDNPYHGWGPLHACYQAARIVAENEDFDLEFIEQGNLPLAFISLDPSIYSTDTAIADFKRYLSRVTKGALGKTKAIVGAGVSVSAPMPTARDLQTLEKLREHKATIRNAFKVPESMLELNSANLASATVGDDQFWGITVRPLLNKGADHLTETLLPMFGIEPGEYFFAYDDPLLADIEREARIAEIDLRSGVRNINEVRAERNLDGIGDDGEVYRINGVPVDQSGQAPAPSPFFTLNDHRVHEVKVTEGRTRVPVLGTLNAKGAVDVDNERTDGAGSAVVAESVRDRAQQAGGKVSVHRTPDGYAGDDGVQAGPGHGGAVGSVLDRQQPLRVLADRHARPDPYDLRDCGCGLTTKDDDKQPPVTVNIPDGLNLTREQAIAFATQQRVLTGAVGNLQGIIADFMRDAQQEAARSVRAGGAIDLGDLEDQLATVLEPEFREMYRAGFDLGALELDEPTGVDPFALPNAEAIAEAETSLIRQLSRDITDHTAQGIESRVRAGIEAGESIDDIAKAIEGDTGFAEYRSERIARTEVSNAANMGKLARYKEAGVATKYWIPGTSAVHRALGEMFKDGVPIDEPFLRAGQSVTAGGVTETYTRDVMAPPARPNCTCTMAARPPEGD